MEPLDRTLEVFQLTDGQWQHVHTSSGEERVRAANFEAIELGLALVWAE
jgi:hypothetical protein